MNQDYKDLLSAFHAHGVKYLVVGGYAVILHARPRFTRDIDFFVRPNSANARATYAPCRVWRGAPRHPPGRLHRPQELLSIWT